MQYLGDWHCCLTVKQGASIILRMFVLRLSLNPHWAFRDFGVLRSHTWILGTVFFPCSRCFPHEVVNAVNSEAAMMTAIDSDTPQFSLSLPTLPTASS